MERDLLSRAAEFISEQRKKTRWTKVVTAMAAVVVFCTTYALILPAITLENQVYCGKEAHSHGADCYGQVLVCDLPEAKAHVHSDGCYEVERTLVCTQAETPGHSHTDACRTAETHLTCASQEEGHVHGDGCYSVTSSVTCGQAEEPGHTHGDGCWKETRTLVCTESTELPEGGHVHGPECYGGEELTCTKKEHEHELKCYSNPKADLESASVWERTLPDQLTGIWADDLLAVAETQLGYQESSRNYDVDNENNKLGYTRYGDWYGSPYGHWCAMFVSFCLHYADIPTQAFPWEANCQQWIDDLTDKDLYRPAGDYTPKAGDLIFFNWDNEPDSDHVGIVQEVTLDESGAVTQIKTIEGNTSNQVKIKTYLPTDESIMGYGELPENPNPPAESEEEGESEEPEQTEEPEETDEPEQTEEPEGTDEPEVTDESEGTDEPETPEKTPEEPDNGFISLDSLLEQVLQEDVSNGPVVRIFALSKEEAPAAFSVWDMRTRNVMMLTGEDDVETEEKPPQNLLEYLKTEEVNGSYDFTLTDSEDRALPQDGNGAYIVTEGADYKLSLIVYGDVIAPGTYYYQLPLGLTVANGTGIFTLDEVPVGTWEISEAGLMTFVLNDQMNNKSNVTITAKMGATFTETENPIQFDQDTFVSVLPADQGTELEKWGAQGDGTDKMPDPGKIYWNIKIHGNEQSKIIDSTITDTLVSTNHTYDRDSVISFVAAEPTDGGTVWHKWTVPFTKVTWNEDYTSWSYKMPPTVNCTCGCNQTPLTLQNNWDYTINYATIPTGEGGTFQNRIYVDNHQQDGWGAIESDLLSKTGVFQKDDNGGHFQWTIRVNIPGWTQGTTPSYQWFITDTMSVLNSGDWIANVQNDMDKAEVIVTRNGKTFSVPNVTKATATDEFAWHISWAGPKDSDIKNVSNMEILHQCHCRKDTCAKWNEQTQKCNGRYSCVLADGSWGESDFCHCWNVEDNTLWTINYKTKGAPILADYGGKEYYLRNQALLYKEKVQESAKVADSEIPGVFSKSVQVPEEKDQKLHFTITVNDAKLNLTSDGTDLVIKDVMTDTLAYLLGSMVITTEDADGNTTTLASDKDFTIEYDGSGGQVVGEKQVHVLTITILNPQPVKYILEYDTTVIIPTGATTAVPYSNWADVTLWGKTIEADVIDRLWTNINIAANQYKISVQKKDKENQEKVLPDAVFGLYRPNGGLITSGKTDVQGKLSFVTNVTEGIILLGHTPYYIQEIQAPEGYVTDSTKHWFYFCHHDPKETCPECGKMDLTAYPNIEKVPGYVVKYDLTNQLGTYELPETGGAGTNGYTFGGLLLMAGAGFLLYRKTRDGREARISS